MKIFVNVLTLLRIFGTLFLPFIWATHIIPLIITYVVILLATDSFDGFLARKFHVQTLFGQIADTIADKILGIVLLIIAANSEKLFLTILVLELLIALINTLAFFGSLKVQSSFLGKCKTWILSIAIVFGLMNVLSESMPQIYLEYKDNLLMGATFAALGAQMIVLLDYIKHFHNQIKQDTKLKFRHKIKNKEEFKKALFDTEECLKNKDKPLIDQLTK